MCQFASFFHNPLTGEVVISDLNSHGNTEQKLGLNTSICPQHYGQWREGHYLPDGSFELRFDDADRVDKVECKERFINRFPNFISFLNWAFKQDTYNTSGGLYLRGLTSAKGLVLPKTVGGSLYLSDSVREELKLRDNK